MSVVNSLSETLPNCIQTPGSRTSFSDECLQGDETVLLCLVSVLSSLVAEGEDKPGVLPRSQRFPSSE